MTVLNEQSAFTPAIPATPEDHLVKFDAKILEQVIRRELFRARHAEVFSRLTGREVDVLQLLGKGMNNPMIAEKLLISRHTVETHRKNLNRKLNITSYCKLVKYALAFDLITY